jgi:hypothetical protein
VPEAEAALKKLREELGARPVPTTGTDGPNLPNLPMVEKFRALARAYLRDHPDDPP